MGQVLKDFYNGWAGTVSRQKDDVIISLKNSGGAVIPYGAPVFMKAPDTGVRPFNSATHTADDFVGFAVRIPDKTPETYGSAQGEWPRYGNVDILVRGSISIRLATASRATDKVYIRKSDSLLTTLPGNEGTTVELPNVRCRGNRDSNEITEVVVTKRNLQ